MGHLVTWTHTIPRESKKTNGIEMKNKFLFSKKYNVEDVNAIALGVFIHKWCDMERMGPDYQFEWKSFNGRSKNTVSLREQVLNELNWFKELIPSTPTIGVIAQTLVKNIRIFTKPKKLDEEPVVLFEYDKVEDAGVVEFEMSRKDFECGDFSKVYLITNIYRYMVPDTQSFVEVYARAIGSTVAEVENVIGGSVITFRHEKKLIEKFGCGFAINRVLYAANRAKPKVENIYWSSSESFVSLQFVGRNWADNKESIYPTDRFSTRLYRGTLFLCQNACGYNTLRRTNLVRHEAKCSLDIEIVCKQVNLCNQSIRAWLIDRGYITSEYCNHFLAYDTETVKPADGTAHKVVIIGVVRNFGGGQRRQVFKRSNMSEYSYYELIKDFVRAVDKAQKLHVKLLPKQFTDAAERIDRELQEAQANTDKCNELKLRYEETKDESIKIQLDEFKASVKKWSVDDLNHLKQGAQYLSSMKKLGVLGFNSQRFDLPLLYPGMVKIYKEKGAEPTIIKSGNGLIRLQCFNNWFGDIKKYIAGGSLANFAETWGVDTPKGIFPYDAFSSIRQLRSCVEWPPMDLFVSCLDLNKFPRVKNPTERFVKAYKKAKTHPNSAYHRRFRHQLKLDLYFVNVDDDLDLFFGNVGDDPDQRSFSDLIRTSTNVPVCPDEYVDNWFTFDENKTKRNGHYDLYDHFAYYCGVDCELTRDAMEKFITTFEQKYDINPLEFVSLPSISSKIIWNHYDDERNAAYTFSSEHTDLSLMIRKHLIGGLSCPFQRHVRVGDDGEREYDNAVYTLPNGMLNQKLISYDFNS